MMSSLRAKVSIRRLIHEAFGMTVLGIHHVQLAMPAGGEGAARSFYSGVLGLAEVDKPEHLQARGGCWFEIDQGIQLHLGVEVPFRPATKAHPALVVADPDTMRLALVAAGAPVVEDTQLAGFVRFYTADPFGNRLEIMAPVTI
jgi:catechol 2,3-dioxygenase-like lactoylglutathione lyase family enzyme